MTTRTRLSDDLDVLHAHYVTAIHEAIAGDRPRQADELSAAYDRDALLLVAAHEDRLDQLPALARSTGLGRRRAPRAA